MTENVWSDFTYFGICAVYKKHLVYELLCSFFVIPMVCSIPEATRYDYFWLVHNWYMTWWYTYNSLFHCCVNLASFFFPSIIGSTQPHTDITTGTSPLHSTSMFIMGIHLIVAPSPIYPNPNMFAFLNILGFVHRQIWSSLQVVYLVKIRK